jgi:hypothetical protein
MDKGFMLYASRKLDLNVANKLGKITITGQKLCLFLWLATNFSVQIDKAFAWTNIFWSHGLFARFLEKKYGAEHPELFQVSREEDNALPWIMEEINPHDAIWAIQEHMNAARLDHPVPPGPHLTAFCHGLKD